MKKIFCLLITMLMIGISNIQAQESQQKLTREEKKALQARTDSLQFCEAVKAIENKCFTLEADQVIFKRGRNAYVNSNTNFIMVKDDNAVVQVSFNIPVSGPNGLGGITVEGNITSYKVKKDKKGNLTLSMNVQGVGISANVSIRMPKGNNQANVDILPNFHSNRLSLRGIVLPSENSRIFKGRSL
ncbi:DUF4251 domain-containing protein [uncultured Bacteroides sp.]|uniref:DUF4251 domain-containing protein n=1 Tax=uncultured Bacteroides sp. TaxID=162156 RepID=UPI0026022DBC|nr:DUF4251 domain-containing protein [uncultured Bacteroides sp.]